MSLEDDKQSGRPSTVNAVNLLLYLKAKPEVSKCGLTASLGCNYPATPHLLAYYKVLARCILHRLTKVNERCRLTICQSLLLRPHCKEFLHDSVARDESWVLYDNFTCHVLVSRDEEPPTMTKPGLHSRKPLLCCWRDAKEMLYFEVLPQGTNVMAVMYAGQLEKSALRRG